MAPACGYYNGRVADSRREGQQAMLVALWLHLLGVVVWIGGMFFAQMALRPSVNELPPPQRLALLAAVMGRFLVWAGLAIVLIFASGGAMLAANGAAGLTPAVRSMAAIAVVMTLIYLYIVARPFRALRRGVAASDWAGAGAAMGLIRLLILINLVLGIAALSAAVLLR
jgi:uncharacterized membrane protein